MKPIHHIRILKRLRRGFGTAVILGILIPQLAVANPLGPKVVSGQANFAAQGKTLTVTNSDRAIINWQDFSIAGGEITRFIQPTATSAVLNRVVGNNPSAIYGALQSNGRVYLVNTNGIFIGPSATIDVNGLVASTLNISDSDFKAGRINFSGGPLSGRIENQGAIRTPAGGSIYLIAPDVTNSGVIHAPNGDILLAAGKQVSLVESTTPEIAVVISAPANEVLNLGRIIAEAGRIGIYGGLIRHRGIVNADSAVVDKTGVIRFRATKDITFDKDSSTTANGPKGGNITVQSTEGTTLVSGAVETKGTSDKGGTIQILGARVGLIDAAQIDASGEQGGGTVLVGGDYQGKNPDIQNAEATYLGKDAVIRADAIANGNGGKVIVWSDGSTKAYGGISAKGGAESGNGGLIETSGHQLDVAGADIDASAPKGNPGTWLLDPYDVNISVSVPASGAFAGTIPDIWTPSGAGSNVDVSQLVDKLENNISVTIRTSGGGGGEDGNITVSAPIDWSAAGSPTTLTLNADKNISINSNIITGGLGTLTLNAGDSITQTGGTITAQILTLNAPGSIALNNTSNSIASVTGNAGSLDLYNRLSPGISVGAGGLTATSSLTLSSLYYVHIDGPVNASTTNLNAGTTILQNGAGLILAGSLSTSSAGGTNLSVASNQVGNFSATNTGGGNILFRNVGVPLTLGSISNPDGDITIVNAGSNITINGNISTTSGIVALTSATNHISRTAGTVSGPGLNAVAGTGIGAVGIPVITQVGTLNARSDHGDIVITNTGALVINELNTGNGTSPTGLILINNTGSVTTGGFLVKGYDDVTIKANSPLTIGTGGVESVNGNINLSAGPTGPGVLIDIMTLDGDLNAGANITLRAGNEIIENAAINPGTGGIGILTKTPNLNVETPPPTPTCPTGQELVGGVCQPITCPAGQQLVGNTCQAITCPTGQQLVGSSCQPIICPTGQQLVGNLCQPIICTGGQVLVGNLCSCPGGKVFIGTGCLCPAGAIDYAGVCKTPSIVPGTDSSTVIYFPVTEELTEPLQVLVRSIIDTLDPSFFPATEQLKEMQSNINTGDPSLFRTSGAPAGGAGDDLKPKKNYCN